MKLRRYFYDSRIDFKKVSKLWVILSIVMGLASALTIYSFFYVISEVFRLLSLSYDELPSILSVSDRNFYNLFFAGLSVVLGNSVAILFVFSRTVNGLSRLNPKRKRILNDQIFLNFNFTYWFAKIGLVFGIFSMCCLDFTFLPYFKPFSFLLLTVLYLESCKTLVALIKKNRFKLQFFHFSMILILTLLLSRLDVVNYEVIDKSLLKNNPLIDLPNSNFYEDEMLNWRNRVVHYKVKIDEKKEIEIFTRDRRKLRLRDLSKELLNERAALREEMIWSLKVRISADRDIDLKYIKLIEAELLTIHQRNIIYDVYNEDLLSQRFENRSVNHKITPYVLNLKRSKSTEVIPSPPPPPMLFVENRQFKDTLNITFNKEIKFNGEKIEHKLLTNAFKKYIDKDVLIVYTYSKNTNYQEYITVLSSHYAAINALKKQKQTVFKNYERGNDSLYRKEQFELRKMYPFVMKEKQHNYLQLSNSF